MFIEERHQEILDMIKTAGRISIGEIQEKFNVSVDSARRDLRILEEKGLLKRTHGGAIPMRKTAPGKPAGVTGRDIKKVKDNYLAIAQKAVSMVEKDDVIYITSATVGYLMTQLLPENIHLTCVTHSLIIAEELRKKENISLIFAGGVMDHKGDCCDAFAVEMIGRLRFDKSFITASAVSAGFGLSIETQKNVALVNAVIRSSKATVGLFPCEKVGFESVISICPADRLDILITDWETHEDDLAKLSELGIDVVIAENKQQ